jgi:uncharacterized delta-60 repeat protein
MRSILTAAVAGSLCWVSASGQTLDGFRSPRLWERFTTDSLSFGPSRSATDGDGGLLFWFQGLDWVNGQQVGIPIKVREADGSIDPLFRPRANAFSMAAVAPLSDGSCFVGVYRDGGDAVERLLPNGRPDSFFAPRLFSQGIRFLTPIADGGVLVTVFGNFDPNPHPQAISVPNPTLVKLKRDGTVDASFKAPEFGGGQLFVPPLFDSSGRIYVAGRFVLGNGPEWRNLVRLKADGSIDTGFAGTSTLPTSLGGVFRGVGLQSSGKVVVVGDIRLPATLPPGSPVTNRFVALRFTENGVYDPSFALVTQAALPTTDYPRMLVVQPTDKLVVAATGLKRLNADGTVDATFKRYDSPRANFWVHQFSDGRLLLPGLEPLSGAQIFLADGTPDTTFSVRGFGGTVVPRASAVLGNGRVVLGGDFNRVDQVDHKSIVVLGAADGKLLTDNLNVGEALPTARFGSGFSAGIDVAPAPDGGFYASGTFVDLAGQPAWDYVVRIKTDGSEDPGFEAPQNETWGKRTLYPAADGGVWVIRNDRQIAVDYAAWPDGSERRWPGLTRFGLSGEIPANFQGLSAALGDQLAKVTRDGIPGTITEVNRGTLSVLCGTRSGGLVVALESVAGSIRVRRLNSDGSDDATFQGPVESGLPATTLFDEIFDPRSGVRYRPADGIATHESGVVTDGTELPDGSILVVGRFDLNGGIALLKPDGSVDPRFQPGPATYSRAPFIRPRYLAVESDRFGRIFVAGLLESIGGTPVRSIAQLDRTGKVVASFVSPLELLDYPQATAELTVQGDTLFAVGTFRLPSEDFPRPAWKLTLPASAPRLVAAGVSGTGLILAVPCDGACPDLAGWKLEGSSELGEWLPVGVNAVSANGRLEFTVPTSASAKFYRLRQP